MDPIQAVRLLLVAGAAGCVAVLACVDVVSWRATAPLRTGRGVVLAGRPRGTGSPGATSPATLLPALAGLAMTGAAAPDGIRGRPWALAACLGAAFVAVSGTRRRVTALASTDGGLEVRYPLGPPAGIRAGAVQELAPPRWPGGAWVIRSPERTVRLMPSDLLGREFVLAELVRDAGLRFHGRRWERSPPR